MFSPLSLWFFARTDDDVYSHRFSFRNSSARLSPFLQPYHTLHTNSSHPPHAHTLRTNRRYYPSTLVGAYLIAARIEWADGAADDTAADNFAMALRIAAQYFGARSPLVVDAELNAARYSVWEGSSVSE
jgi:hypothetical protein